eukprot:TRINITY_DN6260_c0_g1_i1.p1 TRINITY_DN6260_c0_g1~~TRINITY_DN6260_c0_g1_i1.p1  ORF type:complete len:267 (+),score=33.39 TRINITY_DN6260_c0_g1_i1:120-920(+)
MEESNPTGSPMDRIKHKILVLSGKGGVGKSTVSTQLAFALVNKGKKVGLLDVDICGPSVPRLVGLQGRDVKKSSKGWLPVYTANNKLAVMSIGFLLGDDNTAVVWRGPKKTALIKQFLEDVSWGDLDYLIIDTPPGTSDEHLSIVENLRAFNPDGAVLVTTPQGVSISDVRKEISFCKKMNLPMLGIVENMSGFVCPHCKDCTNIFSSEGGRLLAEQLSIPFIGKIPIDPSLTASCENGQSYADVAPDSPSLEAIDKFAESLVSKP